MLHRLPADVQIAIAEPHALIDGRIRVIDVERRRLRLGQDLEVGRLDFDGARRQLVVLGAGQTQRDGPRHGHHELGADAAGLFVGRRSVRLVDDDLSQPVAVAQVQEDQLTVVAPPVDPTRQSDDGVGIGGPQLATGVGSEGRGKTRKVVGHVAYRRRAGPRSVRSLLCQDLRSRQIDSAGQRRAQARASASR